MLQVINQSSNVQYHLRAPDHQTVGASVLFSAERSRAISETSTLTLNLSVETCIKKGDLIQICDCNWTEYWVVTRVEVSHQDSGAKTLRATCVSQADDILSRISIPGATWFNNVDIPTALDSLTQLATQQLGAPILFSAVNFPALTLVNAYKDETPLDGVAAIKNISATGGFRWRSRPDQIGAVVEVGNFGVLQDVTIREAEPNQAVYPNLEGRNEFIAQSLSYFDDDIDAITDLFIEGGSYTHPSGQTFTLLIGQATPPPGFSKHLISFGGSSTGRDYYVLRNDACPAGVRKRFRRVLATAIVPKADANGQTTQADIIEAENQLALAGANYLSVYSCLGKRHFSVAIPGCFSGRAMVGDRVTIQSCLYCTYVWSGPLFIVRHSTQWDADGATQHTIELAETLDSLADPLSLQFTSIAPKAGQIDRSYLLTGTTVVGGCVTIPFPQTYASPPTVLVYTNPGVTGSVTTLTTSFAVVCVSPAFPGEVVTIRVTPP